MCFLVRRKYPKWSSSDCFCVRVLSEDTEAGHGQEEANQEVQHGFDSEHVLYEGFSLGRTREACGAWCYHRGVLFFYIALE